MQISNFFGLKNWKISYLHLCCEFPVLVLSGNSRYVTDRYILHDRFIRWQDGIIVSMVCSLNYITSNSLQNHKFVTVINHYGSKIAIIITRPVFIAGFLFCGCITCHVILNEGCDLICVNCCHVQLCLPRLSTLASLWPPVEYLCWGTGSHFQIYSAVGGPICWVFF